MLPLASSEIGFNISRMKAVRNPMRSLIVASLAALLLTLSPAHAAVPRALPEGQLPNDVRLAPPKDLKDRKSVV